MAEVRRVRAIWTGVAGSPYISTWFFENQVGQVGAIQSAVRTFLTACAPQVTSGLQCNIEADQSIFNAGTGDLIGVESQSGGAGINGSNATEPLPAQDQLVLKLATPGIVNNRRVRGRFFLPGPCESSSSGVPSSSAQTALNTAAAALITATATAGKWVVYSRPVTAADIKPGDHRTPRDGSIHNVQSATAWNKFGVQRRRRD